MKIKTSELTRAALDWAVAKAKGETVTWEGKGTHAFLTTSEIRFLADWDTAQEYSPSTDWAMGGPIIEREWIDLHCVNDSLWEAECPATGGLAMQNGPTPLVAAMRCYVAAELGEEIEIPEQLA